MTATLTDRYIDATVRSLPPQLQSEVRDELRASIADAVDARTDNGEAAVDAERLVLTELGDPGVLAAGYADRPLHLIGPKYYLTWWRLLKVLWAIVPACAGVGVAIAQILGDAPVGTIIGEVVVVVLSTIVHTAFWTTLVFFILERTGADTGVRWSVDSLPEEQGTGTSRGDLIGSLIMLGVFAAALFWDRFIGFVFVADGDVDVSQGLGSQTSALSILSSELWPWWIGVAMVVIAAEAAVAIAVFVRRRWTGALAALNAVIAVAFAASTLYLLISGQLLNPAFIEFTMGRADSDVVERIVTIIIAIAVVGVAAWDVIDGWVKARRTPAA